MKTLFLSDLHLTPERPEVTQAFLTFLTDQAGAAERIYLLGDLFEFWIGDDAAGMLSADPILDAMHQVASKLPCFFIAGNRDFLVGEEFSERSGFTILPDETVIDLYGKPTLLLHGDSLCTDDIAHQQFRQLVMTNKEWQTQFLALPIPQRIEQAKQARMVSHEHKSQISMGIMDVTHQSVIDAFTKYGVQQMIHGHTHRQDRHAYSLADSGAPATRYVLGDWGDTSSILVADPAGLTIHNQAISRKK